MAAGKETMKLMKVVGLGDGRPGKWAGMYLCTADFDANGGIGDFAFTPDPSQAMRFADNGALLIFWNTQSTVLPLRPDGKPNRPLTALTVETVEAPAPDQRVVRSITKVSPISGKERTMLFAATADQWAAYDGGELIQQALPHLSDGEREFLMTGITDEEWDKAFPEDDEADAGEPDGRDDRAF